MVVVIKPGKIRVCLDPRDLIQALQQPKYQMPTLKEIPPSLSRAKVFTALNPKDRFYQIRLDKPSSLKTMFSTPFGCYQYLRMPICTNVAPEEVECLPEKLADVAGLKILRVAITHEGLKPDPDKVRAVTI